MAQTQSQSKPYTWSTLRRCKQAMHAFRDNETTLLLATPAASRGLDLPAVGFVYSLGAPADATDYLHRAGRAGRIGSPLDGAAAIRYASDGGDPL